MHGSMGGGRKPGQSATPRGPGASRRPYRHHRRFVALDASGTDETRNPRGGADRIDPTLLRFVHRGRDWRAWAGARSDYESDSGGVLAARSQVRRSASTFVTAESAPALHPSSWQSATPDSSASAAEGRQRRASRDWRYRDGEPAVREDMFRRGNRTQPGHRRLGRDRSSGAASGGPSRLNRDCCKQPSGRYSGPGRTVGFGVLEVSDVAGVASRWFGGPRRVKGARASSPSSGGASVISGFSSFALFLECGLSLRAARLPSEGRLGGG